MRRHERRQLLRGGGPASGDGTRAGNRGSPRAHHDSHYRLHPAKMALYQKGLVTRTTGTKHIGSERKELPNLSVFTPDKTHAVKPTKGRYIYPNNPRKIGPPRTSKTTGWEGRVRGGARRATPRKKQNSEETPTSVEAIPLKLPVTTILEVKEGEVTCHPTKGRSQRRESQPKKRRAAGVSGHVASM